MSPPLIDSPNRQAPLKVAIPAMSAWLTILDQSGLAAAVLDARLRLLHVNRRFTDIIGKTPDDLLGGDFATLNNNSDLLEIFRRVLTDGEPHRHRAVATQAESGPLPGAGQWDWSLVAAENPLPGGGAEPVLVLTLQNARSRVEAERKLAKSSPTPRSIPAGANARAQAILASRVRLSEMAPEAKIGEIMQATLDDAEQLTGSTIGFFHFVDSDQQSLSLTAWSSNTLAHMCTAVGKGQHYAVDKAGVWADCVRLRKPVVHNDYPQLPDRAGLPAGHAPILRELTLPVLLDGKVVAAIGVGNKPTLYDDEDVAAVAELAQYAIEVVTRKQAINALRERERQTRQLFESMTSGFALFEIERDADRHACDLQLLDCNAAYEAIAGVRRDDIVGRRAADLSPGLDRKWISRFAQVLDSGDCLYFEDYHNDIGRQYRLTAYRADTNKCAVLYDDITATRRKEAALREAAAVFQNIRDGIMITDATGTIIEVNPAFTEITGYRNDEAIGRSSGMLQSGRHDAAYYDVMWGSLRATGFWQGEIWNRRKDGEIYAEWLTITAVVNDHGEPHRYIAVFTDISRVKNAEDRADFIARHDSLTGLPNRSLIAQRCGPALEQAQRRGRKLALLILDLDLFKNINDSLGHEFGDRLLVAIAERFKTRLRGGDTLVRLGGDEFAVLMEDIADAADAAILARGLLDTLEAPFAIDNIDDVFISASIGISVAPDDALDQSVLMRNADAAVFLAKSRGRKTFRFYTESLTTLAHERLSLESRLRKAIEAEHLVLHFQPLIHARSHTIIGAEALVRWNDPEQGLIAPMRFIPVAEDSGLIAPLGAWVLKAACRQMKQWLEDGRPLQTIAVNMSPRQFALQDVPELVRQTLAETGLAPEFLELEITEGILMEHGEGAIAVLNKIRQFGVRLSIDDFGTGYSSLSYLKRFPIDKLKIDQSFVRDITTDSSDAEIVTTIIAMARSLKLSVLAEGVETVEQHRFLEALGCDYYQGYLFSRPVPAATFPTHCPES